MLALAAVTLAALALGGGNAEAGTASTVTLSASVAQSATVDGSGVVHYQATGTSRFGGLVVFHRCYLYDQFVFPYNIGEEGQYALDRKAGTADVKTRSGCRVESYVASSRDPLTPLSNVVTLQVP
jgi:hypothetical protein